VTARVTSVLVFALLAASVSAPAIRFAETSAWSVVSWRLLLSWPLFAIAAAITRKPWPLWQGSLAGALLALHWLGWTGSVQHTTLANASILVTTGSLWTALLSKPLLGEPIARRHWAGLGLALVGVVGVVLGGPASRQSAIAHSFFGDGLALVGALAWTGYTFVGRVARRHAAFLPYTAALYGGAAVVALAAALTFGAQLHGYPQNTWLALITLAILPTCAGHGSFNWLLAHIGPAKLSLAVLIEPALAIFYGWLFFDELPSLLTAAGGLLTVIGVGFGTAGGKKDKA
jgi:drug/metabolite transporter (DMT)-like permease